MGWRLHYVALALILAGLLVSLSTHGFTMTAGGDGGIVLQLCDDVTFTHYANAGSSSINGVLQDHPANSLVLRCPRTKPNWHLTIINCPLHQVTAPSPGAFALTC